MKTFFVFLAFLFPVLLLAQGTPLNRGMDVQHYDFEIHLSENHDEIQALAQLRIQAQRPLSACTLDLVGPTSEGGMKVDQVSIQRPQGWLPLPFQQKGEQLTIAPDQPLTAGEFFKIAIQYHGKPLDGLIISQNRYGHRTFFGDNWPNRAHHWLPTIDHPSDKATVTWTVHAPSHFEVVANGVPQPPQVQADGTTLHTFHETTPLPTKVMVFGAADFAIEHLDQVQGIPVSSWVFPEDSALGFDYYDDARDILQIFIDSIAPYPYDKLANVQSKTRYGGMENANTIFYYESSVDQPVVPLLAHEIAHQWFGNMATEAGWHHIWLSEGFATYFTDLYLEWNYGKKVMTQRMAAEREKAIRFSKQKVAPIVNPAVTNYNQHLNPNSYEKGAWVLHMLRQQLGYPTFMRAIRQYYKRYGGGNATTQDLQRVLEEVSGQNLDSFFKQWLLSPGHPQLAFKWKGKKKSLQLKLEQVQAQEPFEFPLEVGIFCGDEMSLHTIHVHQQKERFEIECPCKAEKVTLDPNVKLFWENGRRVTKTVIGTGKRAEG